MSKKEQIKKEEGIRKMKKQTLPKFAIAVSESGLHMLIDDILTPKESMQLIQDIRSALVEWSAMTGKYIDTGKKHGS
ncbi:MAG: hypothetical protein MUP27_08855 [Desulfobacterales bacterium]|nr:hypothetical protein [Desulfobacterales bacterium]